MLSGARSGRPRSPGYIPDTRFCNRRTRPHGHNRAGTIKIMNNFIGNRTRDLSTGRAVPQTTKTLHIHPLPRENNAIVKCFEVVQQGKEF